MGAQYVSSIRYTKPFTYLIPFMLRHLWPPSVSQYNDSSLALWRRGEGGLNMLSTNYKEALAVSMLSEHELSYGTAEGGEGVRLGCCELTVAAAHVPNISFYETTSEYPHGRL